jgi:hypothetical protein
MEEDFILSSRRRASCKIIVYLRIDITSDTHLVNFSLTHAMRAISRSCPQCSAPRRRYAKKVGDKWGITNDGGDFPIYFTTFAGLALVTYFTLVVVPTL